MPGCSQFGVTDETAAFFLEHLDLLTPAEAARYPMAEATRALVYMSLLQLDQAEALLLDLAQRLRATSTVEAQDLLGDVYVEQGLIHMMRSQEDFGAYFEKAAGTLRGVTRYRTKGGLRLHNKHCFSMADCRPGAKQRMERAMHGAMPWMTKVLGGGLSGMDHLFSAEAAYLSFQLRDAQQHAYRALYKAEAYAQHNIVCNAYAILARIGLIQGDYDEMTRQIQSLTEYAEKCGHSIVNEIRDTALAWYYIKVRDLKRVPTSIVPMVHGGRPATTYGRAQIVYGNYLIHTGKFARLVEMLEHMRCAYSSECITPEDIAQHIMLAIGHQCLDNQDAAMEALWKAYDRAYQNGLTTLFIEGEARMDALITAARQQQAYAFDPEWLDAIQQQARDYQSRAAKVRAAYRQHRPDKGTAPNPLTKREQEVRQALALGMTREEIAAEQYITVNTVKTFLRSIYSKLGATNRVEAISTANTHGWIAFHAHPPSE